MLDNKVLSIGFVFIGAVLIAASFLYAKNLCAPHSVRTSSWRFLFTLNVSFLVGYAAFILHLYAEDVRTYHIIVSLVFYGGGFFVFLVTRESNHTVLEIERRAQLDRHNALHDKLTGLPNRALLSESVNQAIAQANRNGKKAAVVLMDLDRFKEVNDILGHATGDKLLQMLAPRLTGCVRESDVVARLGGDEFAAVLSSVDVESVVKVSKKFLFAIDQPFDVDNHMLHVGVSIGIALYPDHGADPDTLLKMADIAMYKAKREVSGYAIYNAGKDELKPSRLDLVRDVRDAVRHGNLKLVYQPKWDINGQGIFSVEALLRWHSPVIGDVSREVFITVIEQLGLMHEVTRWVIHNALQQMETWRRNGINLSVAVNVSAKNLADHAFPKVVAEVLEKIGVAPECLVLEITENSMMLNPDNAKKLLKEISAMGVKISIDDFGTGYSSLSYLKNLPATEVKIDKSFVTNLMTEKTDAAIVHTTIDLAHSLGCNAVAEGVESYGVLEKISAWGCDIAQGYHIGVPLSPDAFLRFMFSAKAAGNRILSESV